MNYFAHALPFLDDPYFAAGTGVPDWLAVIDRRVRVRLNSAERLAGDSDQRTASIAAGVAQHIRDDAYFHASRPFAELSWELTARARDALEGDEPGFRPAFLGHLLVEVLLDASLIAEDPRRLEAYYRLFESVDPGVVQEVVNRMAARPTEQLAPMISEFCRLRILSDYLEDGKLMGRLNQVMRRVKQPELPDDFCRMLPEARRQVDARKSELLEGIPTPPRK